MSISPNRMGKTNKHKQITTKYLKRQSVFLHYSLCSLGLPESDTGDSTHPPVSTTVRPSQCDTPSYVQQTMFNLEPRREISSLLLNVLFYSLPFSSLWKQAGTEESWEKTAFAKTSNEKSLCHIPGFLTDLKRPFSLLVKKRSTKHIKRLQIASRQAANP